MHFPKKTYYLSSKYFDLDCTFIPETELQGTKAGHDAVAVLAISPGSNLQQPQPHFRRKLSYDFIFRIPYFTDHLQKCEEQNNKTDSLSEGDLISLQCRQNHGVKFINVA